MSNWEQIGEPIAFGDTLYTLDVSDGREIDFAGNSAGRQTHAVHILNQVKIVEVLSEGSYFKFPLAEIQSMVVCPAYDRGRSLEDDHIKHTVITCTTYVVCCNMHQKIIDVLQLVVDEKMKFDEAFDRVFTPNDEMH